mmetsp:Transcript_59272/g.103717  ORF Transcript_59272/g.103717 Transcript_59272/m.103717 type:complete len:211 (-) Transcript_59272:1399-2031(-)
MIKTCCAQLARMSMGCKTFVDLGSVQTKIVLQNIDSSHSTWIKHQDDYSGKNIVSGARQCKGANNQLDPDNRDCLRGKLPSYSLNDDQQEEEEEAECVVHARGTLQCRERILGAVHSLLLSLLHGAHQLARVRGKRCNHEADVKRVDVQFVANDVQQITHGVRKQQHQDTANGELTKGPVLEAALLFLRTEIRKVFWHGFFFVFFIIILS